MSPDAPGRLPLRPLRLTALGYSLFVIYGCLVPLHFTPLPWAEAWARFRQIPELHLGPAFRSDWIANVLLFSLSAYLWIGSIWTGARGAGAVARSVGVWIASVLFVTSLEFAQVYFPPRSVALQDVFAGSVGAAIGIVAWWISARRVLHLLGRWSRGRGREALAEWLLWPYAAFLILYDVMPLDLTSSPHVLYEKWQRHMIWLVPFASAHGTFVQILYDLGVEALLWLPLAALWVVSGRGSRLAAWCVTVLASIGVGTVQVVVQSRVSDVTDVLCAAAGGAVGVLLGGAIRTRAYGEVARADARSDARIPLLALVGFFAWSAVLGAVFCHPFDFRVDPRTFGPRVNQLLSVPFRAYWLGSEHLAFVDLLRKALFFAPLGALLDVAFARVRGPWARRACAVGSVAAVGLVAGFIEAVQVFLPHKVPDSTDALVAAMGGAAGYAAVGALRRRLVPPPLPARAPAPAAREEAAASGETPGTEDAGAGAPAASRAGGDRPSRSLPLAGPLLRWLLAGGGYAVLAILGLAASGSARVPYNVRELFLKGPAHPAPLLFPLVLFAVFLPPALAARWLARGSWSRIAAYPGIVLAHAIVAWIGVRAVIPLESVRDIVGRPVLHWPWEWELIGRFTALFGAISILLCGGTLLAGALCGEEGFGRAFLRWVFVAVPLLVLAHWIVVVKAGTDNLTELMAGGGGLAASSWIAAWLLALAAGGAGLAMIPAPDTRRGTAVLLAAGSVPFGWMALSLGLAPAIAKYGAVLSALQFLLSPDRSHYVVGGGLATRYVAAHVGGLAAASLTQLPLWAGAWRGRR
jgi:VanZ family protein